MIHLALIGGLFPAGAEEPAFSDVQVLSTELSLDQLGPSELGIDWRQVDWLPEPPRSDEETERLRLLQKDLGEERRRRIREQANMTWRYWNLELKHRPASVRLLERMDRELKRALMAQKLRFDRVRPSFVDEAVELVVPNPAHPAYPSGHAAQGLFYGEVFAAWEPHRAEEHRRIAIEVGRNREYAGVHYPSDTQAGRAFARYVIARCLGSEVFLRWWSDAAKEWESEGSTFRQMTLSLSKAAGIEKRIR